MPPEIYLIAPNIRSRHNVGAIFRTADVFGVKKIFLTGYTPAPPHPDISKVALGANEWVPWEKTKQLTPLLRQLKKQGVSIAALEVAKGSIDISQVSLRSPVAIVIGNEVDGVPKRIFPLCDFILHIPMYGKKESLNVSVATGIALYAIREAMCMK